MIKYMIGSVVLCSAMLCALYCNAKKTTNTSVVKTNTEERKKMTSQEMKTTASGLSYKVHKAAPEGARKPKKGDRVVVHYTGWLEKNGGPDLSKKFDSSVDRMDPFIFNVGMGYVIAGWDEGVSMMAIGDKWQFIIPANLGYGARGAGHVIPPNATLVFDVELLDIK